MLTKFLTAIAAKPLLILPVALLLLAASVTLNLRLYRQQKAAAHRISVIAQATNKAETIVEKTYTDNNNKVHTVIKEVLVQTDAEKAWAVGTGYLDTVSKALQLAGKQIDELTRVNSTLATRIKLLEKITVSKDSNSFQKPLVTKLYQDRYLYAEYDPGSDSLLLQHHVTLTTVKYKKKKHLFAAPVSYIDIFSDDPRVQVNGVKRFSTTTSTRPKRLGIGRHISYSYHYHTKKMYPAIGVGLQYNFIQF